MQNVGLPEAMSNKIVKGNQATQDNWSLFAIIGGTYNDANKILTFSPTKTMTPAKAGETVSLEMIYMAKDWLPLVCTFDKNGNKVFSVKDNQIGGMRSRCVTIACRVQANELQREVDFRGFDVATDNVTFAGTYNLATLKMATKANVTYTPGTTRESFRTTGGKIRLKNATGTGYYFFVGIPKDGQKTTNARITPVVSLVGQTQELETGFKDYENKPVAASAYLGINKLKLTYRPFVHPIEGFLELTPEANNGHMYMYRPDGILDAARQG